MNKQKIEKLYEEIMGSDENFALWVKALKDLSADYRTEVLTSDEAISHCAEAERHLRNAMASLIAAEIAQEHEDMINQAIMKAEALNEGE